MMHIDTTLPPPTHPTKDNPHLDVDSHIRFSPKLCRWAFNRKTWRESGELWSKVICCILWYWTNSLTVWRAMQAWMKTTTSILFLRPTQECLETPTTSIPSFEKEVKPLGASAGYEKSRCEEHESEVSSTDHADLNNLGVGKQILLPHGDFQVGELMDQQGTASSSAEVPRCLPSGKKAPRTEAKNEASSTYGWRRAWFRRRWDAGWWR